MADESLEVCLGVPSEREPIPAVKETDSDARPYSFKGEGFTGLRV